MRISKNVFERVMPKPTYSGLKTGATFVHETNLYMKTSGGRAVRLSTGVLGEFAGKEEVYPTDELLVSACPIEDDL